MTKEYWEEVEKVALERREVVRQWLDSLDTQRAEALQELSHIEQLLHSVAPFTSNSPLKGPLEALNAFLDDFAADGGLADAVRLVLSQSQRYMTPSELRDILEASKYDLTQHSNPLASIHGILKRFEESGEVSMVAIGNKASYRIAHGKKERPAWQKHLMKTGGLKLMNPPYAKQKKSLSVREAKEAREAQEAVEQMEMRKRKRESEAKKKS